jgi:hypothetical protein
MQGGFFALADSQPSFLAADLHGEEQIYLESIHSRQLSRDRDLIAIRVLTVCAGFAAPLFPFAPANIRAGCLV